MNTPGVSKLGTAVMAEQLPAGSPRWQARLTGVVYLLFFVTAIAGKVFIPATADGILAHEAAFRLGFALGLVSLAAYLVLTALFYNLLTPVSRNLALCAAFFSLIGCATQTFGSLFQLAPLVLLSGRLFASAFTAEQLQALAQFGLDLSVQAASIGLVFFALFDLTLGWLILRSTLLPRLLGVLMVLAGVGWLAFLYPPLANALAIYIDVLGFLAEALLMLWLLVKGINAPRQTVQP